MKKFTKFLIIALVLIIGTLFYLSQKNSLLARDGLKPLPTKQDTAYYKAIADLKAQHEAKAKTLAKATCDGKQSGEAISAFLSQSKNNRKFVDCVVTNLTSFPIRVSGGGEGFKHFGRFQILGEKKDNGEMSNEIVIPPFGSQEVKQYLSKGLD